MKCPKCKGETEILFLTDAGQVCRACKVRAGLAKPDPEDGPSLAEGRDVSRAGLCLMAFCFALAAIWAISGSAWYAAKRWLGVRRVCSWCEPKHYIGGNPLAGKVSHGICRKAFERTMGNLTQRREEAKTPRIQIYRS